MIEALRDDVLETCLQVKPEGGRLAHSFQVDHAVMSETAVSHQEEKSKQGDELNESAFHCRDGVKKTAAGIDIPAAHSSLFTMDWLNKGKRY